MLIDHTKIFFTGIPKIIVSDIIGRISFPIFMFLFIDGFFKTKHPWKHVLDLTIFGIISEIIYDLYFYGHLEFLDQNILFSWSLSYLFLIVINKIKIDDKSIRIASYFILTVGFALLSKILNVDYSICIILISMFVYLIKDKTNIIKISTIAILESLFYLTPGCLLAIPIVSLYKEEKECKRLKYIFYIFYPSHLLILFLIKLLL